MALRHLPWNIAKRKKISLLFRCCFHSSYYCVYSGVRLVAGGEAVCDQKCLEGSILRSADDTHSFGYDCVNK